MSYLTFLIITTSILYGALFTKIVLDIREIRRLNRLIYGSNRPKRKWSNRA